jgi:hypothetical protein
VQTPQSATSLRALLNCGNRADIKTGQCSKQSWRVGIRTQTENTTEMYRIVVVLFHLTQCYSMRVYRTVMLSKYGTPTRCNNNSIY